MRTLLLMFALVACSSDNKATTDAPVAPIDTPVAAAPDCTTYCTNIAANCTTTNAQFGGSTAADATAHCMATCAKFPIGAATDTSGNTLGCRLYHANAALAMSNPALHCPHAGPAGDKVDLTGTCGDPCTNFCTLEIAACGLMPASATGQYTDMGTCMNACAGFNKTHPYTVDATGFPTVTPKGDSLACRLYHTTNALITGNAAGHCPHTAAAPAGAGNPCLAGSTPTP